MILKKYNINLLYYYIIRRAKFSRINRDCGKKNSIDAFELHYN